MPSQQTRHLIFGDPPYFQWFRRTSRTPKAVVSKSRTAASLGDAAAPTSLSPLDSAAPIGRSHAPSLASSGSNRTLHQVKTCPRRLQSARCGSALGCEAGEPFAVKRDERPDASTTATAGLLEGRGYGPHPLGETLAAVTLGLVLVSRPLTQLQVQYAAELSHPRRWHIPASPSVRQSFFKRTCACAIESG